MQRRPKQFSVTYSEMCTASRTMKIDALRQKLVLYLIDTKCYVLEQYKKEPQKCSLQNAAAQSIHCNTFLFYIIIYQLSVPNGNPAFMHAEEKIVHI